MTKRLHGGSSPLRESKYKLHFEKIKDHLKNGNTNKKKKNKK